MIDVNNIMQMLECRIADWRNQYNENSTRVGLLKEEIINLEKRNVSLYTRFDDEDALLEIIKQGVKSNKEFLAVHTRVRECVEKQNEDK